jgi:hypothetical protein
VEVLLPCEDVLEFGVELMSEELPAPEPDTLTLSTTLRLPAND